LSTSIRVSMAFLTPELIALIVLALVIVFIYLYITSIEKVLEQIGFSRGVAGTLIFVTLFLGWIPIPLFPYHGWLVGISVGGGLIPILVCAYLLRARKVAIADVVMGTTIVAVVTYFVTRAVQNVGIVADIPWAFLPAAAAGFFSISTFWSDMKMAAPLAYFSGVIGTLLGADVFHLGEILGFPAPPTTELLVIGGAGIFDMVYLTGIVAVFVDIFVFWIQREERKHGLGRVVSDFERETAGPVYMGDFRTAEEPKVEPTLQPGRRGTLGGPSSQNRFTPRPGNPPGENGKQRYR
jgi:uncharacterized membrane protein